MSGNKDIEISGPGEWALKKTLGPLLGEFGDDLGKLYSLGRDRIVEATLRKIKDPDDGASANLRVARDAFWNGSYTDESICAEYFGGILASSRSADGKDDTGVFYADIIKSLSSSQLTFHYIIYRTLNKLLISDETKKNLNPSQASELHGIKMFIPLVGISKQFAGEDVGVICHGLDTKGLIDGFDAKNHDLGSGKMVPYVRVTPTPLGVMLFAIANNMFSEWRLFSTTNFGDFPDVTLPQFSGATMAELLEKAGLKEKDEAPETPSTLD